MTNHIPIFRALAAGAIFLLLSMLSGCDANASDVRSHSAAKNDSQSTAPIQTTRLDVYKSPTCGCCEGWIEHLDPDSFEVAIHHPANMSATKAEYGIAAAHQSCHTAVSEDGYVFEGHIPQKFVQRFLAEKPEGAIGLAVPGMPIGSPGMAAGQRFTPYQILQIMENGDSLVYAEVRSLDEQYN